jgi:hypothetical protein
MSNHIDTFNIRKYFKEDQKININIIKEEYGRIINIHGIWYKKTTLQQDIIIDLHLLQIGESSTTIHGIKGKQIMQQLATKDYNKKYLIFDGWIIINGKKNERTYITKSYYLVSSHVNPLIANL